MSFDFSAIVATIFVAFFAIIIISCLVAIMIWAAKEYPRALRIYLPEHSFKIYHWLSAHTADIDDLRYRSTADISTGCKLNPQQVRRGCSNHPYIYHLQDGSFDMWTTYPQTQNSIIPQDFKPSQAGV